MNKRITILDSNGNFVSEFPINMWPASITFGNDGSLFIVGFPMSYKDNLIQHYSLDGKFINSFCKRGNMSREVMFSGNAGRLSTDSKGDIFYMEFYPYQIEEYTPDGKLLNTITDSDNEFIAPKFNNGMVDWTSGLRGVMNFNDNRWGVIVYLNKNTGKWRLDLYDSNKRIEKLNSDKDFPLHFSYRCSAVDSKGNLYFDIYTQNEPLIVKYKLALSRK